MILSINLDGIDSVLFKTNSVLSKRSASGSTAYSGVQTTQRKILTPAIFHLNYIHELGALPVIKKTRSGSCTRASGDIVAAKFPKMFSGVFDLLGRLNEISVYC